MPAETLKPNQPSSEGEKNRYIHREVKEMVSTLTKNLASLHSKPGSSHELGEENEHGLGIITLAGTNSGAIMRGSLTGDHHSKHLQQQQEENPGEEVEDSDTYVNSNYQAVNNSIMLGASYTSNDPGVHVDIREFVDPYEEKLDKHESRVSMRKGKEPAVRNQYSDFSE